MSHLPLSLCFWFVIGAQPAAAPLKVSKPIEGSSVFSSYYEIQSGSASKTLVQAVLALEKTVEGIQTVKGKEATKKDQEVRQIVSEILDLDRLGQKAISHHWDSLGKTPKGRKWRIQYQALFKQLVEENYLDKVRVYVSGKYAIPLMNENSAPHGVIVQARIKKTDLDLILEFQFFKKEDRWAIEDIRLDETSLEAAYRSSFNRIIQKKGGLQKGFPELLRVMNKRLTELKEGRATKL